MVRGDWETERVVNVLMFCGAAGEVTGSHHLVETADGWIALDCGLFQGHREDAERKNRQWCVAPNDVRAVVLSHAHTDHSGRLPRFVRDGFRGPIYCTPATRDLCAVMLPDSAHIQVEDIHYVNLKRRKKGLPPVEALYDERDALAAVRQMRSVPYDTWFHVTASVQARFREAGHMLGSAGIELRLARAGDGDAAALYFTGDVGRRETPILRDPAPLPEAETVICESTYGGRVHESGEDARQHFTEVVKRTYQRQGKVIVPAFSVGRTQTLMYFMHQKIGDGTLPPHPVFIDSPLAIDATEVYRLHPDCFDEEAARLLRTVPDLLGRSCCTFLRDVEESKRLNAYKGPCMIISASGMCEAGRVRHHIKNNIEDAANTILIPGFQAEGTLGRRLVDGADRIVVFHETYRVRAEVVQLDGFSGHADQPALLRMLSPALPRMKRLFLVHGEPEQSAALAAKIRETGFAGAQIAKRGESVKLA